MIGELGMEWLVWIVSGLILGCWIGYQWGWNKADNIHFKQRMKEMDGDLKKRSEKQFPECHNCGVIFVTHDTRECKPLPRSEWPQKNRKDGHR